MSTGVINYYISSVSVKLPAVARMSLVRCTIFVQKPLLKQRECVWAYTRVGGSPEKCCSRLSMAIISQILIGIMKEPIGKKTLRPAN